MAQEVRVTGGYLVNFQAPIQTVQAPTPALLMTPVTLEQDPSCL